MTKTNAIVGDPINFSGLIYSPTNEQGVVFLFGKLSDYLQIQVEEIKQSFPDCIGLRRHKNWWKRIIIEFEYYSKNFLLHKHNINMCDIIICWENNWIDCPIEIIELKSIVKDIQNLNINKYNTNKQHNKEFVEFINRNGNNNIRCIIKELIVQLQEIDEKLEFKIGESYLSVFSPKRSFATFAIAKKHVKISCFARGEQLEGTKISNDRFSPRWCTFSLYNFNDIEFAIKTLKTSHQLMIDALAENEKTHYLSQ